MNRLRNKLLALACVLAFAGFGVVYVRNYVVQKPFGIVLFVCDGVNLSTLALARERQDQSPRELRLDGFRVISVLSTQGEDPAPAGPERFATMLATGERRPGPGLSLNADGKPLETLLDYAHASGRSTGIVTNGPVFAGVAAAFAANVPEGATPEAIAAQYVDVERADVLLGCGIAPFLPVVNGGTRTDGRDLLRELEGQNFDFVSSWPELIQRPLWKFPRVAGLFPRVVISETETGELPTVEKLVGAAIRLLQYSRNGYVVVVEISGAPDPGEKPDVNSDRKSLLQLDRAVNAAREYAGESALILVVGKPDFSKGGAQDVLALADGPGADEFQGVRRVTGILRTIKSRL